MSGSAKKIKLPKSVFMCPLCKTQLFVNTTNNCLICEKNHSFDFAKEKYVNLLPVDKKHTKMPGDSKEMVQARRMFLQSGAYAPFSQKLNMLVENAISNKNTKAIILDAGCGEGYYTNGIAKALAGNSNYEIAAFDISKLAVKAAAKKALADNLNVSYAVASSFHIPLKTASVDVIVNIFSPMAREEFLRVLKPKGTLIFAVPGPRHLFGLKQVLYENPYENKTQDIEYKGFELKQRHEVRQTINVPKEQIENLFAMTPYYWKTSKEGALRLQQQSALTTEIHFDFLCYTKI